MAFKCILLEVFEKPVVPKETEIIFRLTISCLRILEVIAGDS